MYQVGQIQCIERTKEMYKKQQGEGFHLPSHIVEEIKGISDTGNGCNDDCIIESNAKN